MVNYIEIIKQMIANGQVAQDVAEKYFPELKESEDERIRESLLEYLHTLPNHYAHSGVCAPEWIAWLEKQGEQNLANSAKTCKNEQKPIINVPPREVILAIWDLGNEWKELTNGCISTEHGTQLEYIQKHWHESEYYLREKQGEQKSVDKVESKFKVGDWVVYDGWITQIKEVYEDGYSNVHQGFIPKKREEEMYLWTIQDAKDGDVLYSPEHNILWVYMNKKQYYGAINLNCANFPAFGGNIVIPSDVQPATKEQRDTLLKAMADAGYTFDFEKKELRKIEQKPTEPIKGYDFHDVNIVPKFKKGDLIREKLSGKILTIKDFSYDNGLYTYDTGQFPITIQDNCQLPTN